MAPPKWLLDLLACPSCRTAVTLQSDGSGLKCASCRRIYPVEDDIPVMLISEARIEDGPS